MKKIKPKNTRLKTVLLSAYTFLLIPFASVSAAPSVHQDSSDTGHDCYTPAGAIVNNCGPNIFLLDGQPTDTSTEPEQAYWADNPAFACITGPTSDQGITGSSYDNVMASDLLSALSYSINGVSVSQTNPVRENDLTTTPTICTRKDDAIADTYYMSVFPPFLRPDQTSITVGMYEPANTVIPTTPVEVTCEGADTYGDCEAEALAAYITAYGASAVPLIQSTFPVDNDDAVHPETNMLSMTFNEPVGAGATAGNGYLKRLSDGVSVETFNAGDLNVGLDLTGKTISVGLSNALTPGTDYYVELEIGAVGSQASGNSHPGITFNDTWNFTTNSYPVLAGASITGVPQILSTLTAVPGAFSDPDAGDTAGTHLYEWFSGTDNTCNAYATPIAGEATDSYSPVAADFGKFVCVAITPKDNHDLEGATVYATSALEIVKAPQTITFNDPADLVFSPGLTFTAPASSTSDLAVSLAVDLTSSSMGVCTVSGNTVTVVTAGNCDLITSQTGDATYNPAASVRQTVVIAASAQTLSFADPADFTGAAGETFSIAASVDSGLPVTLSTSTPAICTVSGLEVTVVDAGTCSLTASQAGNASYQAATAVSHSVMITTTVDTTVTTGSGGGGGSMTLLELLLGFGLLALFYRRRSMLSTAIVKGGKK